MLPPASTGLDPTARVPSPPPHRPLRVQAASCAVALRPAGRGRGARSDRQSYKHSNVRSDVLIGGGPRDFLSMASWLLTTTEHLSITEVLRAKPSVYSSQALQRDIP